MKSLAELERHLEHEEPRPFYALVGADRLLVGEAVAAVRDKTLTRAPEFNRHEFSAADTPIAAVVEAAGTLPMLASRRFVHLTDVHALKAAEQPSLVAYLERPAPHTVLCLSGEKIDGRTKLGQKLSQSGALVAIEPPRPQELAGFVQRRARKRRIELDTEAAQLLADLIGAETGVLDRALEKAALYAGEGARVTVADVEETVAPTRLHSIFELTDAVGQRDLGRASALLRNALGGGESALGVLAMITRQFRQLLRVKALAGRGAARAEITERLGIRPFLVDALVAQARRYDAAELEHALDAALRADIRLKSTRISPGVVLDRLLVDVLERSPR